ncbi:Putative phosphohydrolase [Fulvivirga imtechensis AK7]|uniref:Putative phosphohydrolase n=1 Tax=Fulvivirga imtechensis AK7 TaxID=1237149 RepID=L8JJF4_9BACT|nr:metallophosphoesterase [Fulvivirga imtechensis]ELR68368.1 Putative phosphohydrolase [Fulvivirga imtechensis AK7]
MKKEAKQYLRWLVAGALGVAFVDAFVLERYFFRVRRYHIGDQRARKVFKMVLITDLHLRHRLEIKYRRLAARIRALQPDILLISGDAIDQYGRPEVLDNFLSLLDTDIPRVAIPGNHEHKNEATLNDICRIYQKHQVDLLVNATKTYRVQDTSLTITGLDDSIEGQENFSEAIEGVDQVRYHIVLLHSPLQQESLLRQLRKVNRNRKKGEKLNVSYLFAGHNHGGQVTFFGLFPILLPKGAGNYVNGWYNDKKPYLYVSKGFGTSTVPFRFGARAEMTVLDYHYM